MKAKQLVIFCLVLLLVACSQPSAYYTPQPYLTRTGQVAVLGAATGAAIGGYYGGGVVGATIGGLAGTVVGTTVGYFLEQNQTLLGRIRDQGVQLVVVGDNVLFILPSDKFFYADSPHRIHINDFALDDIARLIKRYEKITVRVAAYTDATPAEQRALALTQQQAQAIADYLWETGIDTRILYGRGFGSSNPIANNQTAFGRAQNRRIEIRLRVLPGCCVLAPGSGGA